MCVSGREREEGSRQYRASYVCVYAAAQTKRGGVGGNKRLGGCGWMAAANAPKGNAAGSDGGRSSFLAAEGGVCGGSSPLPFVVGAASKSCCGLCVGVSAQEWAGNRKRRAWCGCIAVI